MADGAGTKEYMSRSWRMLTHDKGWYKPLLVLPLAKLVPIAGPLGVWGYQAEWARLSAWGKETYPKQRNVKIGACIRSGWRAFLAMLGCIFIYIVLLMAVRPSANGLAQLLWSFVTSLWFSIAWVAALRATIYQHASAGYQLDRIWEMLKRDFGSIVEIALALFVGSLLIEGFCILCTLIIVVPSVAELAGLFSFTGSSAGVAVLLAHFLARFAPWLVLVLYAASVFATALQTVAINALGLWFQQFDVPDWGSSKDPLPNADAPKDAAPEAPASAAPAGEGSAAPAQEPEGASAAPSHEEGGAAAPASDEGTAADVKETEEKKPLGGLPAVGESSAPADEPATLILSHRDDSEEDASTL